MGLLRRLIGKPLANEDESAESIGVMDGVPVFGLDALGSAAYGPEAALTVLIPLGLAGLRYIVPLSAIIVTLLLLVYFSYIQTIDAYPGGGGAYTVAGQNLGRHMGMLAGASLLLDYLLNVSVGISTGIGALISAVPRLQPHTLGLCLLVLCIIVVANLRGVRDTGVLWRLPTLFFVASLLIVLGIGFSKMFATGGHPVSRGPMLPHGTRAVAGVSLWLLLRSFASGCTALTGVEAVSNGVQTFAEPKRENAKRTLTLIVTILGILVLGIAVLVRGYGVTASDPGKAGYQSIISLLVGAVIGRGVFYQVTLASVLVVLCLSANTSFADFPRVCRMMADDGFMPKAFRLRGRRLVYTAGILVLGIASAGTLILFGGITDRLIPLFAIGAFTAFTLSQVGMVVHWRRAHQPRARLYLVINLVGAVATGAATLMVFIAKFTNGAWMTVVALLALIFIMRATHKHYAAVEREMKISFVELVAKPEPPIFLLPVGQWNRASVAALRFATSLGGELRVLHVNCDGEDQKSIDMWRRMLQEASERSGVPAPTLVEVCSEYRAITAPIFDYVQKEEAAHPNRTIAVVFPELVAAHWYQHALHNYRAEFLKMKLFFGGRRRIAILDVPWQLSSS